MRKTALVIEDTDDNLRLITYALERAGYEVISAGCGEEGIKTAAEKKPGLIIMDILLPGIDGLETTRRIRLIEGLHGVPIIAMTSFAMSGDREKAFAAGCNGYIEKPIDPLNVVRQIHGITEKKDE